MYMIHRLRIGRRLALTSLIASIGACGGGGDTSPGTFGQINRAPSATAGVDRPADEFSTVTLDGSGSSDPDVGDTLTYVWTQTAGASVAISGGTSAQATFDAPDVMAASPETLTFQLAVSDGTLNDSDTVSITVNDIGLGANNPPLADAGVDQTVDELAIVNLDGGGSLDPDGDALTYAWLQTAGPTVVLSDATAAQATFTSPDVVVGAPETLTFQLTVDDSSENSVDTLDIVVQEGLAQVTVAGTVSYEFVNPNANCGLNFNNTDVRPIRAATVQLISDSGAIIGTTVAADDGSYSIADVDASTNVRIRVRAELKRLGSPNWDVDVRDNVDTSVNPPPLNSRPLYVVQFPLFDTGVANINDADFTATTGWGGAAYTGTRAAAPFAILDTIFSGMRLVMTADANANFSALDAFWSVNNTLTGANDIDAGELSSSFYSSNRLFLLGDAAIDTEEFDDHVTMHEWGHYFEDNFSRSDSIGGSHSIGQTIDPRLAFGEGWATALAAMALDNPRYCDTRPAGSNVGFEIDIEGNNSGPQGFYNEMSVATMIYDLWDTDNDGTDTGSIGFGPIFDVMTTSQATTAAYTTLFSFATELRTRVTGADLAFVDSQLVRENVDLAGLDIFGSAEFTQPGGSRDVLPIYTDLAPNGTTLNICTNSDFDSGRDGNKLSEYRFLRITTSSAAAYDVVITTTTPTPVTADTTDRDQSDPDIYMYLNGVEVARGISGTENSEVFVTQILSADTYVADLQEFRFSDADGAPASYPERICFDVTMTPR